MAHEGNIHPSSCGCGLFIFVTGTLQKSLFILTVNRTYTNPTFINVPLPAVIERITREMHGGTVFQYMEKELTLLLLENSNYLNIS